MEEGREEAASTTLEAFLGEGIDRAAFIASWLRAREIPRTVVPIAGRRHVVVRFAETAYDPLFRMKTVVAHHDRAPGTPGANDNSAACFQLMLFAERLARWGLERPEGAREAHNVRIIFTDGEEAAGTRGIAGQGAYALGTGFRSLKRTEEDVYVLDATGRGDTLILSTAALPRAGRARAARSGAGGLSERIDALHESAARLAQRAAGQSWLTLHTPYSDDAGFLAAGIAAQVVTVLPRAEAETLARALMEAGKESDAIRVPDGSPGGDFPSREALERSITLNKKPKDGTALARVIPETWRLMHTEADSARTLTSDAFILVARFLEALACSAEPFS